MKKLALFLGVAFLCGCSAYTSPEMDGREGDFIVPDGTPSPGGIEGNEGGGDQQTYAGKVTAGEWRDLDNWLFWSNLMTNSQIDQEGSDYTTYSSYWGFYTNNRVAVSVTDASGAPQKDVPVQLVRLADGNKSVLYEARTDNKGQTNLWIGLTQLSREVDASSLELVVNGADLEQAVEVTAWGEEPKWNACTMTVEAKPNIDIAFIVDATGSMYDEIAFLKADLTSIISTVSGKHSDSKIRTAALFYRDEGDDYLTRHSDFSNNISTTTSFIDKQYADGGGDYPEAVHSALEVGLQKLSWNEQNSIRLAFMLLDAPPHKNDQVIASLQKSIPQYAKQGIRIIPVAASGVDKPTEFFLRFAAIATDGTYVFLTNHSGIGNDHIAATVGEYEVELLNELMVRLIDEYLQ